MSGLTVEAALARIFADVPTARSEEVPLSQAYGRLLAEAVIAPMSLPPWANSAMDGFAVRAADVPGTLRVLETIGAGSVGRFVVGPRTASRVMTGAPVPPGADAVVMVEDSHSEGDLTTIRVGAKPGQHIRPEGADVVRGAPVLAAGTRLTPGAVGLLASLGLARVGVAVRPKVAILSTGDEVVAPGTALGPGQIYSSNNHALVGLVLAAGAEPIDCGIVGDNTAALRAAFAAAAAAAAIVVSTGGVSVGDFDHVKEVVGAVDFGRVRMTPGKPLAYGRVGTRPFFGLPGNPVSCMVNFLQFVRPFIRQAMGDPRPFLPVVHAALRAPVRRHPGRVELLRVRLEREDGRLFAVPAGRHQGSGNVVGMAEGHGFALLDAETTEVSGVVRVQVFDREFDDGVDAAYGWGTVEEHPEGCC